MLYKKNTTTVEFFLTEANPMTPPQPPTPTTTTTQKVKEKEVSIVSNTFASSDMTISLRHNFYKSVFFSPEQYYSYYYALHVVYDLFFFFF